MFNIFRKCEAQKKLEETDDICMELGNGGVMVIGVVVKQEMDIAAIKDIDYRLEAERMLAKILHKAFECELEDCLVALLTAVCFLEEKEFTYEECAREFITCLNICNMNQRLKIRS